MKIHFLVFIFTLYFSNQLSGQENYTINAELINVEYFSKSECSEKSPLLVRVTYKVSISDLENLKMNHKYKDGITISTPVTMLDKQGNCVYEFCSQENKKLVFTTVFVKDDGSLSNGVFVYINPDKSKIIVGTAPKTVKLN